MKFQLISEKAGNKFNYSVVNAKGKVVATRTSHLKYVAATADGKFFFGRPELIGKNDHAKAIKAGHKAEVAYLVETPAKAPKASKKAAKAPVADVTPKTDKEPTQRDIIVALAAKGKTHKEIHEATGIGMANIYWHFSKMKLGANLPKEPTQAERILALHGKGKSLKEICELTGISMANIYWHSSKLKLNAAK